MNIVQGEFDLDHQVAAEPRRKRVAVPAFREQDIFDFAVPGRYDLINAGLRKTDCEEVVLVLESEMKKISGESKVKWNIHRRRNNAAILSFETASKQDRDNVMTAINGFRQRFNIANRCQYKYDNIRNCYMLQLELGKFID